LNRRGAIRCNSDVRQILQSVQSARAADIVDRLAHGTQRGRRTQLGRDTIPIGALSRQETGRFFEAIGDVLIHADGHTAQPSMLSRAAVRPCSTSSRHTRAHASHRVSRSGPAPST
jgi:hypothetical protein